jgi:hypothetical protein
MLGFPPKSGRTLKQNIVMTDRRLLVVLIVVLSTCTVAIWQNNRDILRDLFDYSTVITSAGKVEAGFKPYTGVRSPMQSSVYLFNYATEQVFGRNYLALTWGGLVQALGGAWLILALLYRSTGAWRATLIALAITLAGLLQHVVFFYNPLGVLCLSVVVLGLALEPQLEPWRSWRALAIVAAVFIGGINKLNFQGAALLLGGLITIAGYFMGRIRFVQIVRTVLILILFGLILPLVFELAWTGATLREWLDNVVLMPTARHVSPGQLVNPNLYLRPIFDFHHHMLVKPIGGIGLLLMVGSGLWLAWTARLNRRTWPDYLVRLTLVVGGWLMGTLLMLTNHESVLLTSLSFPVLAVALYFVYRGSAGGPDLWMGRMVFGSLILWTLCGGYATWHGSRVLYALNPPPRSNYVRVKDTSGPMAYFYGVRLLPEQKSAYDLVIARLADYSVAQGNLKGVLFGPGFEWMERFYPETITKHEPIWYHNGTTFSEDDLGYFKSLLSNGTGLLVTQRDWQSWPNVIQNYLKRDYRPEHVGSRDLIYHPRGPVISQPTVPGNHRQSMAEFRAVTESNVMLAATRITANMQLEKWGEVSAFGAKSTANWSWPLGTRSFTGKAVARLSAGVIGTHFLTFRIMSGDANSGELLWETPVTLSPDRPEVDLDFSLNGRGKPLWLETIVNDSAEGVAFAGWRDLHISYAGELDRVPALPFNRGLQQLRSTQTGVTPDNLWFVRNPDESDQPEWHQVPAENWRMYDKPVSHIEVTTEFLVNAENPADPVVVTLGWYRGGRFEIMTSQMIDLREVRRLTLQAYFPEPTGWVGLLTRPAGGQGAGHLMKITRWEVK